MTFASHMRAHRFGALGIWSGFAALFVTLNGVSAATVRRSAGKSRTIQRLISPVNSECGGRPGIGEAASGAVTVVWYSGSSCALYAATVSAKGHVGPIIRLSQPHGRLVNNPAFAEGPGGAAVVAWDANGPEYARVYSNGVWGPALRLAPGSGFRPSGEFAVAMDSSGRATIIEPGNGSYSYLARIDASGHNITFTDLSSAPLGLAIDGAGNALVTLAAPSNRNATVAQWFSPTGQAGPIFGVPGSQSVPLIVGSEPFMAWGQYRGHRQIVDLERISASGVPTAPLASVDTGPSPLSQTTESSEQEVTFSGLPLGTGSVAVTWGTLSTAYFRRASAGRLLGGRISVGSGADWPNNAAAPGGDDAFVWAAPASPRAPVQTSTREALYVERLLPNGSTQLVSVASGERGSYAYNVPAVAINRSGRIAVAYRREGREMVLAETAP